jgi:SagB-type dehydrogenase family enzyme
LNGLSGAVRYHETTKHTPWSVRYAPHFLDWANRPNPFKVYPELKPLPLPPPAPDTGVPCTSAIAGTLGEPRPLDAPELSRLLNLAAGINKVFYLPDGERFHFRTYACAGALYPIELYVACGGIPGLEPGLYHFAPVEKALRRLRSDDPRSYLLRATGGVRSTASAPLSVLLTGIPWRTTWKYRQRGYRHLFWDSGMILANLLALSASGGHSSEVVLGFQDEELNRLLGLDGRSEFAICVVPIGAAELSAQLPMPDGPPPPIDHPAAELSAEEEVYQEVLDAHRDTSLLEIEAAGLWHQPAEPPDGPPPPSLSSVGIERTIRRRGSKRRFDLTFPIPAGRLPGILDLARYRLDCDWGGPITRIALAAHAVEDLQPGAYDYQSGFELLAAGDLRRQSRYLCLEQPLGGDGAATLFMLAGMEEIYGRLGARGYRAAQLDAGITAGRLYLGAYACGFGATGLTFYDDEVRAFFKTEDEPMLVVALGR